MFFIFLLSLSHFETVDGKLSLASFLMDLFKHKQQSNRSRNEIIPRIDNFVITTIKRAGIGTTLKVAQLKCSQARENFCSFVTKVANYDSRVLLIGRISWHERSLTRLIEKKTELMLL